jgi:murein DD-endopeptidase MepM/ murein hydrolase activator NlpD
MVQPAQEAQAWKLRYDAKSGPLFMTNPLRAALAACSMFAVAALGGEAASDAGPASAGLYRLPFANDTQVSVFDDFMTHRPHGRVDLFATGGHEPYRVVAAAAGRIMAIQDSFDEQQSGRAAADCHNNFVWIAHPNGEWTNYSHLAHDSVTKRAKLKVGDHVSAGTYLGDEGAVGCAMLKHVHFEVAMPDKAKPIDAGGFLTDNERGKRERNPRFCGVTTATHAVLKGETYRAMPCPAD